MNTHHPVKAKKLIEKFETKKKKMRYNQAKDTNKQIYQSQLQLQKRRNNFMVWKMQIVNLKKMKGKIDFWQKRRKTKSIEYKDDKEREKNARPKKNNDEIQKNKARKNITYLTISDSESEDDSIIHITESINEERKKRTIYSRVLAKQKINESDISQIFDKYGEA